MPYIVFVRLLRGFSLHMRCSSFGCDAKPYVFTRVYFKKDVNACTMISRKISNPWARILHFILFWHLTGSRFLYIHVFLFKLLLLWRLAGGSAAVLSRLLSNFKAIINIPYFRSVAVLRYHKLNRFQVADHALWVHIFPITFLAADSM